MRVTILGCGASGGVPVVGCQCAVCRSDNPKNKRTRTSALIEVGDARLLIDSSPDLRQQALRERLTRVDGVLYTHNHADHTNGVDDLRAFNYHRNAALDIYGTQAFLAHFTNQFRYAFQPPATPWYRPALVANEIQEYDDFSVNNLRVRSFLQLHGKSKTLGYRIGNMAYSTDVDNLPDESLQLLESLDLWVVDCLRYNPSPTHANLAMTLGWIEQFKPKRAVLIHMNHDMDYDTLRAQLPPHVEPAYDGLVIECL